MKLKILQVGEPVLRQPARPLSAEDIQSPPIQQLIELMRETMQDAPGVGLAAPQVGLPLQLAVIEDRLEYHRETLPSSLRQGKEPRSRSMSLSTRSCRLPTLLKLRFSKGASVSPDLWRWYRVPLPYTSSV
jgi:Polypeptide deformylase